MSFIQLQWDKWTGWNSILLQPRSQAVKFYVLSGGIFSPLHPKWSRCNVGYFVHSLCSSNASCLYCRYLGFWALFKVPICELASSCRAIMHVSWWIRTISLSGSVVVSYTENCFATGIWNLCKQIHPVSNRITSLCGWIGLWPRSAKDFVHAIMLSYWSKR